MAGVNYTNHTVQPFEVYAVRLGQTIRNSGDNFLLSKHRQGEMLLDFDIWVLKRGDLTIVVDTGMSPHSEIRRNRTMDRTPFEAVEQLGVDPSSVQHLVLTHLHYDHAGRTDDFPNAKIWIQSNELDYALGGEMRHPALSHFFEVEDLKMILERIFASNISVVNGSHVIMPGLELHLIGGHTRGLQVVRVFTKRGWIVLASDALHYYENFELRDPFPSIVDVGEMMGGYERVVDLADSLEHIIPGHDPGVMIRYPGALLGLTEGIVALHELPANQA